MATKSFELRELFHLTLLRHLGTRLSGRSYAVKGGICLRFFHRSARLSEDMDLDIVSRLRPETLRRAVDSVVDGRALAAALVHAGVTSIAATKPKQTDTTQRWKITLFLAGEETLRTKVEFSRRQDRISYATGIPDAELLRHYKLSPFAAQYYDGAAMAAQKIAALAAPSRSALRDFFDLHHLLFAMGVDAGGAAKTLDAGLAQAAAEKLSGFTFKDFKEQVVPYLAGNLIDLYREPAIFEKQKNELEQKLAGMPP